MSTETESPAARVERLRKVVQDLTWRLEAKGVEVAEMTSRRDISATELAAAEKALEAGYRTPWEQVAEKMFVAESGRVQVRGCTTQTINPNGIDAVHHAATLRSVVSRALADAARAQREACAAAVRKAECCGAINGAEFVKRTAALDAVLNAPVPDPA